MEYALGDIANVLINAIELSLNPCFNGICSRSALKQCHEALWSSLNPCFNGICSRRAKFVNA